MKIDSMKKLYIDLLKDIYNAETQMVEALPRMIDEATHAELRSAFEKHLKETQTQVTRLKTVFEDLGESPKGEHCEAMEGLVKEGAHLIRDVKDDFVKDAGLIIAAQKIEHYEIANYGSACSLAKTLGETSAAELLHKSLEEEKGADQTLARIAKDRVNADALATA